MIRVEVAYYPGDGNSDPSLDDDGPGFVAFARLSDGTLGFPMSHPAPFANREDAERVAPFVRFEDGAIFVDASYHHDTRGRFSKCH
jgi:hypothetical protein